MSKIFITYISLILLSFTTLLQSQHTQPPGGLDINEDPEIKIRAEYSKRPDSPMPSRNKYPNKNIGQHQENEKEREARIHMQQQECKTQPSSTKKKGLRLQFINESDHLVAAWLPKSPDCWFPETLLPKERGNLLPIIDEYAVYIYTLSGFFLISQNEFSVILSKEEITGQRASMNRMLGEILREEGMNIVVTISSTGEVRFEKRK